MRKKEKKKEERRKLRRDLLNLEPCPWAKTLHLFSKTI
jgi:hypothetical protein